MTAQRLLSRRNFLAGSLAAATGLALAERLAGDLTSVDPDRFVLLSNVHLWENRTKPHAGVKPAEQFEKARPRVTSIKPRPAAVLVCGDCGSCRASRAIM